MTIWQWEVIRTVRDKTRMISAAIQPVAFLFVLGSGLRRSLASGNLGIDHVELMYPGIIALTVMGVAFFSTISAVWDRGGELMAARLRVDDLSSGPIITGRPVTAVIECSRIRFCSSATSGKGHAGAAFFPMKSQFGAESRPYRLGRGPPLCYNGRYGFGPNMLVGSIIGGGCDGRSRPRRCAERIGETIRR
jgi:hypothetical protein